ncbi:BTB/POZ domain-containing protein At1g30440 [Rosa chinensis]|nr:BTB/POZ domain-containing protein At1g30440 [Rosa chinensis]
MASDNSPSPLLELPDFPGGADGFLYIYKLCYGIRGPLTASKSLPFLCAADYLDLKDELISQTMSYLSEGALYENGETCAEILKHCDDRSVREYANRSLIAQRCIQTVDSHVSKYFLRRHLPEGVGDEAKKALLEAVAPLYFSQVCQPPDVKHLIRLHRAAVSLVASQECLKCLEHCIGAHLHEVSAEALCGSHHFDSNTVHRLVNHYLRKHEGGEEIVADDNQIVPESTVVVANLVDKYLLEKVANLSVAQFQELAASVRHARAVDDNLYFAITLYLQYHPNLAEPEREQICQSLNCENLTPEVRIQAANSRNLPLRTVVELFYLNNQELKDEVEEHKNRISYLESVNMMMNEVIENLRKEVEKLGSGNSKGSNKWTTMSKKLGFSKRPLQLGCRTSQDAVHNPNPRRKDNILPENTDSSSEE